MTAAQIETTRPYRLYVPATKAFQRWRCYKHLANAHWGVLKELRWAEVGTTIEIQDITTTETFCSYTRRIKSIDFIDYKKGKVVK